MLCQIMIYCYHNSDSFHSEQMPSDRDWIFETSGAVYNNETRTRESGKVNIKWAIQDLSFLDEGVYQCTVTYEEMR